MQHITHFLSYYMKESLNIIFTELFYVLSGALILFAGLEIIWPGVVLAYLNINWALIFWLIDGMFLIVTFNEFNKK